MILAIDPGPTRSAWCLYDNGRPTHCETAPNLAVLEMLWCVAAPVYIEMIASYGMPVGAEVFETCVWIGRFMETRHEQLPANRITRMQVKMHLCHSAKANDAAIRQVILDRYGGKAAGIGRKHTPGPLYGISGDGWAALAVAITADETVERYGWPPMEKKS